MQRGLNARNINSVPSPIGTLPKKASALKSSWRVLVCS